MKLRLDTLRIASKGVAIPPFWILLLKAGCSNFKEQAILLTPFVRTFGKRCIARTLGDRALSNEKLFQCFNKGKTTFYIRIKKDLNVCVFKKKWDAEKLSVLIRNAFQEVKL